MRQALRALKGMMFDFTPPVALSKAETYREMRVAARALIAGEDDAIANMANMAALIWQYLPALNWAGFYRVAGTAAPELVLGPFIGKPACIRIPYGPGRTQGVCGAAAATHTTQLVSDVHAFPGHIACDPASRSELVVPVLHGGVLIAVIDLDSPEVARFDAVDAAGIEALAEAISAAISGAVSGAPAA